MQLSIATYHYVRNTEETAFPRICALDVAEFRDQVKYIKSRHTIVSADEVIATVIDPARPLPERPALLTFDDGYMDHFDNVLPILQKENVSGAFFPPAGAVLERRVLDVNKIHFVLAKTDDILGLVGTLKSLVNDFRSQYNLDSNQAYWDNWAKPNRWDIAEVIFIKRMLQTGLPPKVRAEITDLLFKQIVSNDEADFSEHLYMSTHHLEKLLDSGMYIGNHGYEHDWLNNLTQCNQELDVDKALSFMTDLGVDTNNWMMCYPYGGYNEELLEILRNKKCAVGLSVQSGIADLKNDNPLILPRIDANDVLRNF